ncbi:arsenical resistance operon repressor [Bacillus sp. JCM 19046]|nr:arsenical resistance operon repressor [Bacillus sp. JCM 19045]GAF17185.1 arsenical resistance operon repressor [Bacillus sp. JCM 19046]
MEKEKHSIEQLTACLKIVADPTRFLLLKLVDQKTYCVCELVEMLHISQPAVSQHLRKLKDFDLLIEEKREQWRYFSINRNASYYHIIHELLDHSDDQDARYLQALEKEGLARC